MKILHTSDWHLGKQMGNEPLKESFLHFFSQLYSIIDQNGVEAVIVAGDIYDNEKSNAEAIRIYNEVATEICLKRNCHLIVIAGNHDGPERLATCGELLNQVGLHVRGRLSKKVEPVLLDNDRVAIYPVPYFNRQEVAYYHPDIKISSQQDAAAVLMDDIRRDMDKNRFNIMVSHSLVTGYELSDSDHTASIGGSSAISGSVFDGFDYVALGHIHKPMSISDTIRYSGSPLKYCFGEKEEPQTKGVVLLDTETGEQTFIPVPLLRDVCTIKGTYDEILRSEDVNDDYLFIRLTDRRSSTALYDELKKRYPGLVELRGSELEDIEKSRTTLTLEQMEKMDELSIMRQFFKDIFEYEPNEKQESLFQRAIEETEKGEDRQ